MTQAAYNNYNATSLAQFIVYAPNITTIDTTQAINAQACSSQSWNTASLTSGTTVMAYLEGLLSCSEWCNMASSPLLFYKFTNVSMGMPTAYCYDILSTNITAYSKTAYIVAFVMTGIAMLAFIFGCWLRSEVNSRP